MAAQVPLHIVFGPSAAGSLRRALQIAGRNDKVLCPFDDFSFGPIAANNIDSRSRWVENVLGYTGWQDVVVETAQFLKAVISASRPSIAWVSFREARSYASFLWCVSHLAELPCSIMSVPGLSLRSPVELGSLLDCEIPISTDEQARRHAQWRLLQAENAPLRIIDGDDLISAPLTQFDASLLSHTTSEWQPKAKIVGKALADFSEVGIYQTGDLVLASRLADLAEEGTLKWRGDLSQMPGCELRLPY